MYEKIFEIFQYIHNIYINCIFVFLLSNFQISFKSFFAIFGKCFSKIIISVISFSVKCIFIIKLCSSEINIIANVKHIRVVPKFAILWQNHIPVNVNVLTTSMISNDINKQSTLAINI